MTRDSLGTLFTGVLAACAIAVTGLLIRRELFPPPPPQADPIEQLKQLADLHSQGVLTDEEFAAQKAKLLG